MADQQDVVETTTPEVSETVMASYSADDLAKAREQEKAKLYPQMEKMKEELAALKKAKEEEEARKQAKAAERAAKEAERIAEKQNKQKEQE